MAVKLHEPDINHPEALAANHTFSAVVTGMSLGLKNELGQHNVSFASENATNTISSAAKNTEITRR